MKIFPLSIPGKFILILIAMGFWFIFSLLQWPGWMKDVRVKRHVLWLSVDLFSFMVVVFGLTFTGGTGFFWWILLVVVVGVTWRRLVLLSRALKVEKDVSSS